MLTQGPSQVSPQQPPPPPRLALAAPPSPTVGRATILSVVNSVDRDTGPRNLTASTGSAGTSATGTDFDILTAAVVADGTLVRAVPPPSTAVTLFAPNDRAFQLLAKDLTGKWYWAEQAVLNAIVGAITAGTVDADQGADLPPGGRRKVVKADVPLNTPIDKINDGQMLHHGQGDELTELQSRTPRRCVTTSSAHNRTPGTASSTASDGPRQPLSPTWPGSPASGPHACPVRWAEIWRPGGGRGRSARFGPICRIEFGLVPAPRRGCATSRDARASMAVTVARGGVVDAPQRRTRGPCVRRTVLP